MVHQQMMRLYEHCYRFALRLRVILFIAAFASLITSIVRADGGTVLWQRTTGPFTITAFANESPLRSGPADISFLIESIDEPHPILDAHVFITLENEAGKTIRSEATHRQARNKLLYCGLMTIPEAGHWTMKIIVEHRDERFELLDHVMVNNKRPMLIAYWKLLAFPPAIIALFLVSQWVRRNQTSLS